MCSLIKNVVLIIAVTLLAVYQVSAIKCFKCSNENECEKPDFVECNAKEVKETSMAFSFLPKSQSQVESTAFNCAAYHATLSKTIQKSLQCYIEFHKRGNSSSISLSGCFYNTYNPCEDIHTIPAQKWTCKYCDTRDGCNPASKILENVLLIGIFSIFVIYLQKLY